MSHSPARLRSLQTAHVNDRDHGHYGCEHGHAHDRERGCVYGARDGDHAHVHDGGDGDGHDHGRDGDRGHGRDHGRGDDGDAPALPDGTGSYRN